MKCFNAEIVISGLLNRYLSNQIRVKNQKWTNFREGKLYLFVLSAVYIVKMHAIPTFIVYHNVKDYKN